MEKKKDALSELRKKLLTERKNGWLRPGRPAIREIDSLAADYVGFLNAARTERLAVAAVIREAKKAGFSEFSSASPKDLKPGAKFYHVNRAKSAMLMVLGREDVRRGLNLVAAHVDSPRLDLKQNPLIEDGQLALFKTHYYGGIKKYHWLNTPLAMIGVIVRRDGTVVNVDIGSKEEDPVFLIPDLLIHLSRRSQEGKKLFDAYTGEHLNVIAGAMPFLTDDVEQKESRDRIKLNVMNILNEKYGVTEADFNSAEIELVPAGRARMAGLDRSLIAGYGQDDRACAFTMMRAILSVRAPQRTCLAVFADKEEIGSEGVTALRSWALVDLIGRLVAGQVKAYDDTVLRKVLSNSYAISADVDGAMDPTYKEVNEPQNNAMINHGVSINKYTGHGGKYSANDANAEYAGKIRRLFSENNIQFQFTELGKVDEGGGGTVAKDLAHIGFDVVDCGPPVLGMHSPCELTSKLDIFQAFSAYKVFYEKMK